jgi:hypothetical protein
MIIGPDDRPRRWDRRRLRGGRRSRSPSPSPSLEASHDLLVEEEDGLRYRRCHRRTPTTNCLRSDSGSVPWEAPHAYRRHHHRRQP